MSRTTWRGGLLALLVLLSSGSAPAGAEEGLWPFTAVPRRAIESAHGFSPSDEFLERLQRATVKFGPASGAFISADGLLITAYHVALDYLPRLSRPDESLTETGFVAGRRADERPCPGVEVLVLDRITDVTSAVNAAVRPKMAPAEAYAARRAAMARLERAALERDGLRSEVVTLYSGALFHLYQYRVHKDVRLVFAPDHATGMFGGEADNFNYPRHALDAALFRVYENGEPLRVTAFLPAASLGAAAGDLVFMAGHPASTQRLHTSAHLDFHREVIQPLLAAIFEGRVRVLRDFAARGPEEAARVREELWSAANALKSIQGEAAALRDPGLIAAKRARDAVLRERVTALKQGRGDPWADVAAARRGAHLYYEELQLIEVGFAFMSRLFHTARLLVRMATEFEKPEGERLPEFSASRRAALEHKLLAEYPIDEELERAKLTYSLGELARRLPHHPVTRRVLAGKSPARRAAALAANSQIEDPRVRRELLEGGLAAVRRSSDPMIKLALAVDGPSRALRTRFETEVLSVERDAYSRLARAIFALDGTAAYPDATWTLRLSYGAVRGYEEEGESVAPFTTLRGLFQKAAPQEGSEYRLDSRWRAAGECLDLDTPLNFVTTNDIVGGNSGSPVVNTRGELVGVAFDGNRYSYAGYFLYDGSRNRSISVDIRALREALRVVYGAPHLARELEGGAGAVTTAE